MLAVLCTYTESKCVKQGVIKMSDEAKKLEQSLPPGVPRANDGTAEAITRANGEAAKEAATATDTPQQSFAPQVLNQAQQVFVGHCQAVLETVIWGTITKFQGFNANVVAIAMCRAMGIIVGTMFHGSLSDILNIRRQCREAFLQGLTSSPSPHLYQQQPPAGAQAPGYGRQKVNGK